MTGFQVYLVLMLDGLSGILFLATMTSLCLTVCLGVHFLVEETRPTKWMSVSIITAIISALLFIAVPTTNQAALIYVLPKIANNQEVGQLPAKLVELANKKLDEMLKTEK